MSKMAFSASRFCIAMTPSDDFDPLAPQREAAFFYGLFLRGHSVDTLRQDIDIPRGLADKWVKAKDFQAHFAPTSIVSINIASGCWRYSMVSSPANRRTYTFSRGVSGTAFALVSSAACTPEVPLEIPPRPLQSQYIVYRSACRSSANQSPRLA